MSNSLLRTVKLNKTVKLLEASAGYAVCCLGSTPPQCHLTPSPVSFGPVCRLDLQPHLVSNEGFFHCWCPVVIVQGPIKGVGLRDQVVRHVAVTWLGEERWYCFLSSPLLATNSSSSTSR